MLIKQNHLTETRKYNALFASLFLILAITLLSACASDDSASPVDELLTTIPVDDTLPSAPDEQASFKAPPVGVYHSAGALRSTDSPPVVRDTVNSLDYVNGSLVRIPWDVIHLASGTFDLSLIETELEQAELYDTHITLAIQDSMTIPDFILNECENFTYYFAKIEENITTCIPWDRQYQFYKNQLVAELGRRFDNHPRLAGVYYSYSAMTNGMEMHWRISDEEKDVFIAAGYTEDTLVNAYNTIMDMYIDAFSETSIIMEIHNVFEEPFLAERGFTHCYTEIGERCGVAIWWCAEMNTTGAEANVWPVAQQAADLSFAVCQTVGNFTNQPDRFDENNTTTPRTSEEAMLEEITFFVNEGITMFEIWSEDITEESLVDTLIDATAEL